ncbi:hypothetical protein BDQ94DRAFT_155881 [Aspergillus welwitschiae]|uniref:Uncharacterized protein n=1 Tax=Aspergillus welwitschiae TaxID=1341132 RepID=A0A3F3PGY9_9EURO|nr:hypothetical protein BDQ94DRAFT_155881 [Aspergillus welwitschiae]RDH26195.1 hypothetical protein BDQ94DRAFT_155881 [Aspergillus welwitschiae]
MRICRWLRPPRPRQTRVWGGVLYGETAHGFICRGLSILKPACGFSAGTHFIYSFIYLLIPQALRGRRLHVAP